MIKLENVNTIFSGAIPVYTLEPYEVRSTVGVEYEGKEGTAIVVKSQPLINGQVHLLHLDVNWKSFYENVDE